MLSDSILYRDTIQFLTTRLSSDRAFSNAVNSLVDSRGRFVAETLDNISSDKELAVAGLLYAICKSNQECRDIIEEKTSEMFDSIDGFSSEIKELLEYSLTTSQSNPFLDLDRNDPNKIENAISGTIVRYLQDIRALFIELVYRLSKLKYKSKFDTKFEKFALDTFQIFAPIANRLGLWRVKWQLEDFSFKEIHPQIYRHIAQLVSETRQERENYIEECIALLEELLLEEGLVQETFNVQGRSKGIYSTYNKMKQLYCYGHNLKTENLTMDDFFKTIIPNIENIQNNDNEPDWIEFDRWFNTVYDLVGIRIICQSVTDCYTSLNAIQKNFPQAPTYRRKEGELVDYIANPKSNGYQSIHTVVFGADGKQLEVQIRTFEMHQLAEYGAAAHWKYKESGTSKKATQKDRIFIDLKEAISSQDVPSIQEGLKTLNTESEIYAITPDCEIVRLTRSRSKAASQNQTSKKEDSSVDLISKHFPTPVDFAYHVHTDLGNHCAGAKVNNRMVSLNQPLKNGDIVEIITQENAVPRLEWLEFVATSHAAKSIQKWHKRYYKEQNISRGRSLLEKEFGSKNSLEQAVKSQYMREVAQKYNYKNLEDLLSAVGGQEVKPDRVLKAYEQFQKEDNINIGKAYLKAALVKTGVSHTDLILSEENSEELQSIAEKFGYINFDALSDNLGGKKMKESMKQQVIKELKKSSSKDNVRVLKRSKVSTRSSHYITELEGIEHHIARCCNPVPGDEIVGVITRGSRGISIHHKSCNNVENIPEDRQISVSWNNNKISDVSDRVQTYPVNVSIQVVDRVGILNEILSLLTEKNINVHSARVRTYLGEPAIIELGIDIRDREQLDNTRNRIQQMRDVFEVRLLDEFSGGGT